MSIHTYFKITSYQDCALKGLSEKEIDNYIDTLEQAVKRCDYWHRRKLLDQQLVIIKYSRWKNEIVDTIKPPIIFAVLTPSKKRFNEWKKDKAKLSSNFIGIHIDNLKSIKDYTFDFYETPLGWDDIEEHERVLNEVKCRCKSEERALRVQYEYSQSH